MRISLVSPSFYPAYFYGGSTYATYSNAKLLADEGLKVFVSTTNANGNKKLDVPANKFLEIKKNLFVKYYSTLNRSGFSLLMFLFLWKDLTKADVVELVSIFSPPTPLTLFFAWLMKKQVILAPHGQLGEWCLNQRSFLKKLWLKIFIIPFINRIIWHSTSKQESDEIVKLFGNVKVFIIPHSLCISDYELPVKKTSKGFYEKLIGKNVEDKKIIVSLSRLHKKKGYDILIKAFKIISKKRNDHILIIAGSDYGEKENLINLIDYMELTGKVFIIDHIEGEDKKLFLINADLFALASHNENFGIVYAEAMAAGLPVIASKNTPWQDVEKYNCGFWIDNTPEAFAETIEKILNSDFKEMGKRGRDYVAGKFNSQVITEEYIRLFNSLLKN